MAFRFEVVIRWPGNPDLNQLAPIADSQVIHDDTLTGLVSSVMQAIGRHDAGSGNFAPDVVTRDGQEFCTISYNGRCWRWVPGVENARATELLPAEVDAQVERDVAHTKREISETEKIGYLG